MDEIPAASPEAEPNNWEGKGAVLCGPDLSASGLGKFPE